MTDKKQINEGEKVMLAYTKKRMCVKILFNSSYHQIVFCLTSYSEIVL